VSSTLLDCCHQIMVPLNRMRHEVMLAIREGEVLLSDLPADVEPKEWRGTVGTLVRIPFTYVYFNIHITFAAPSERETPGKAARQLHQTRRSPPCCITRSTRVVNSFWKRVPCVDYASLRRLVTPAMPLLRDIVHAVKMEASIISGSGSRMHVLHHPFGCLTEKKKGISLRSFCCHHHLIDSSVPCWISYARLPFTSEVMGTVETMVSRHESRGARRHLQC